MNPKDLIALTPAMVALIKAIRDHGDDPATVIPQIARSYAATGRAERAAAEYLDEKFGSSKS